MTDTLFHNLTLSEDRRTLTFTLSPTRVTYANSLRRSIQTEVKTLGFRADMTETGSTSDVKVFKNSTAMSNEMLADRVGLVPIQMPASVGKGWEKESVLFRLHVTNESPEEPRLVTASDFECFVVDPTAQPNAEEENSLPALEGNQKGGGGVAPPGRKMVPNTQYFLPDPVTGETCLLAVLKPRIPGQPPEEIHIEAYASMGTGREHTRFNPASQCAYGYTRDTDPGRLQELFQNWLREQKKLDPSEVTRDADRKAVLEREFASLEIHRCFKIDADGEPYSYDFTVETLGTMPVQNVITEGLMGIVKLCQKYASLDKGELPENLEIRPADAQMSGFDFWFTGEDHTLGNLIQTWLDDNLIGRGEITFAGYKIPHPLKDEMVLRVGVQSGQVGKARLAVAQAAQGCADIFLQMTDQFITETIAQGIEATPRLAENMPPELRTVWEEHKRFKEQEKKSHEDRVAGAAAPAGRGRGGTLAAAGRGGRGRGRGGAGAAAAGASRGGR
jgi:DNA-directed RNA polymerase subunit L/DNA-directed RNA polymerase alpha subunit